jgi:hypothetical protein
MSENADVVETYKNLGFVGPLTAFSRDELVGVKEAVMDELESDDFSISVKRNRHLDWDVARRLTYAPAIIDVVTRLLGPDLQLWRTNFFIGIRGRGVRWHQDQYNGLLRDTTNQVSVHLGITEATSDNCVMVSPGSHLSDRTAIAESGFNFIDGTDEDGYGAPNYWRQAKSNLEVVKMMLKPGEFFVFHPMLLHASLDVTSPPPTPPPSLSTRPLRNARKLARGAQPRADLRADGYPRIGFALRIAGPHNEVFKAAFAETVKRGDHCVKMPVLR